MRPYSFNDALSAFLTIVTINDFDSYGVLVVLTPTMKAVVFDGVCMLTNSAVFSYSVVNRQASLIQDSMSAFPSMRDRLVQIYLSRVFVFLTLSFLFEARA